LVEADRWVAEIAAVDRRLAALEAKLSRTLERAQAVAAGTAAPLQARRRTLEEGLETYCEAERPALTQNGRTKTVHFPAGDAGWKKTPDRVVVDGALDVLAARFEALGLQRFLRVRSEPDKAAMLREAAIAGAVEGVRIVSGGESFFVRPLLLRAKAG
jgi:phage host-nuclease inhibitor protein Gam